ncbi:MAG TPA: hypothetical protein PLQ41_08355 [bacterium]|nr:hypothetical protein [bacterium]HPP29859.1 hypothetical protein [bacterium]
MRGRERKTPHPYPLPKEERELPSPIPSPHRGEGKKGGYRGEGKKRCRGARDFSLFIPSPLCLSAEGGGEKVRMRGR